MLLEFDSAMETLVIVEQYRDEFCYLAKTLESDRLGNLTIKEGKRKNQFRPNPLKISSIPVYLFSSPRTPPPSADYNCTPISTISRSAVISINREICRREESNEFDEHCCYERLSFPELWAGPTYSNSPPASSLPMPKFSMPGNRTVSLEFPTNSAAESVEKIHPTWGRYTHPSTREPFHGADSATRTLRRILNLDIDSE
ncbi:uncharacterized protein LOC111455884 [Cucurbita moschata]|uniref:Uncharacterized protein LOC111455884 n=1 Tax=Cucurbita moschata TaxID=3662 RepID=A0A6J1GP91_CUCMO|nr:uncharacterized protein LOC111455884 [Cucurbita moschata]